MFKNWKSFYGLVICISSMWMLLFASDFNSKSQTSSIDQSVQTEHQDLDLFNKQQRQLEAQQRRLDALELFALRQKMKAYEESFKLLDRETLRQYRQILFAIGFDLDAYLEGIKKILDHANINNMHELELEAYLKKLQNSLLFPKDVVLTKENLIFLQNNHHLMVNHISMLQDLLVELAPRLPFGYLFQEEQDLLKRAISLIEKIKTVDIKTLKYSGAQLRFMLSVANVAIPVISTLWTTRKEHKTLLNNLIAGDYWTLLNNLNTTFNLSDHILSMLLTAGSDMAQRHAKELERSSPENVYHVPNLA